MMGRDPRRQLAVRLLIRPRVGRPEQDQSSRYATVIDFVIDASNFTRTRPVTGRQVRANMSRFLSDRGRYAPSPLSKFGEGHMPSSARVALITGCGKPIGIGNSTARALAAAGVPSSSPMCVPTGVANEHNVAGRHRHQLGRGRQPRRGSRQERQDRFLDARRRQPRGGCPAHGRRGAGALWPARHPRQQCRRAAGRRPQRDRGCAGRGLGPDYGGQRQGRLSDVARRGADDAEGRAGAASSASRRRRLSGPASTARPTPPRRRRSSASPDRWPSTSRRSGSPSTPSAPGRSAPRGRSAPTGANMATISKSASASAPRRSRSAASAAPTRSPR